jgi:hypothetical protein
MTGSVGTGSREENASIGTGLLGCQPAAGSIAASRTDFVFLKSAMRQVAALVHHGETNSLD